MMSSRVLKRGSSGKDVAPANSPKLDNFDEHLLRLSAEYSTARTRQLQEEEAYREKLAQEVIRLSEQEENVRGEWRRLEELQLQMALEQSQQRSNGAAAGGSPRHQEPLAALSSSKQHQPPLQDELEEQMARCRAMQHELEASRIQAEQMRRAAPPAEEEPRSQQQEERRLQEQAVLEAKLLQQKTEAEAEAEQALRHMQQLQAEVVRQSAGRAETERQLSALQAAREAELEAEAFKRRAESESWEARGEKQDSEIRRLGREGEERQMQMQVQEQEREHLEEEVQRLRARITRLEDGREEKDVAVTQEPRQVAALKTRVAEREATIRALKERKQEAVRKLHVTAKKERLEAVAGLQQTNVQLEGRLQQATNQIQRLQSQLDETLQPKYSSTEARSQTPTLNAPCALSSISAEHHPEPCTADKETTEHQQPVRAYVSLITSIQKPQNP
ncbi:hypothetical protein CYMTET_18089 [Cymbomonas tetramitiformis]|uniref:Uncharacterized protein n=1 Tax=Cymbomonas tetramitiformis TaxID=36881 RepID=A0AAE0L6M1_9CHLO|nr:hypothetical protein CYMTET_18089 [Cymbomonas tetramitiformis]